MTSPRESCLMRRTSCPRTSCSCRKWHTPLAPSWPSAKDAQKLFSSCRLRKQWPRNVTRLKSCRGRESEAPLLSHDDHHHPLGPLAVELGIKHPLPCSEKQFAVGHRQDHLMVHQQGLQM